jgi:beta-lactamase superfamily II metal-dependent hydrolase
LDKSDGNFNQKNHPVNPITYMQDRGISSVFRFVVTHPDMDHIDGITDFFAAFPPINFYDTDNTVEKDAGWEGSQYREEDWLFYKSLRDGDSDFPTKRLVLYPLARGPHRTMDWKRNAGGDGIWILAPSRQLAAAGRRTGDCNDCSYVILYKSNGHKILFGGDSHDGTWDFILKHYRSMVTNIDLLIAPHHGRDSERSYEFLDTLQPRWTFFGNARHEHLAYDAWNNRDLTHIQNNQAGCMIVKITEEAMHLYVTHEPFARELNSDTIYDESVMAYYCGVM